MMVTGFYAALAASASVFIGILTALLASNLSNLNAQRDRIERRIERIDAQLENLDAQYNHFRDTVEQIRDASESEERRIKAEEQVQHFMENHVGTEFVPLSEDDVTIQRFEEEFANYLGIDVDNLNDEQRNLMENQYEEFLELQEPTERKKFPGLGVRTTIPILPDPEITAAQNQMETQWEIHQEERFNRNYRQWIQTMTEIRSLQDERERLADRHESLDPLRIRRSLYATVVTIILSVGVPLLAYLLRVSEFTIVQNLQTWVEPTVIFVMWAGGLIYVFKHLWNQVNKDDRDLPQVPEVTLDEDTETIE